MTASTTYTEVIPPGKPIKRAYLAVLLWFVGRAIQAAAAVDDDVRKEFAEMPDEFTFRLGVMPNGPCMVIGKDADGRVRFLGSDAGDRRIDLDMKIRGIEAAMLMFTFRESTAAATCHNRLIVDGEIPPACGIVRILDRVEVYLMPKIIATLAVKRYPLLPFGRKLSGRIVIYLRALLGI